MYNFVLWRASYNIENSRAVLWTGPGHAPYDCTAITPFTEQAAQEAVLPSEGFKDRCRLSLAN